MVCAVVVLIFTAEFHVLQIHDPSVATYYTNRALCYLKLKMWENVCQDCRRAIEIESSLVKAYFFQGQALYELEYYDESIASLKRGELFDVMEFCVKIIVS